jgi:hypothetical protein
MQARDWRRVIDEAAAMGVEMVQFIGGEPTLNPDLPGLVGRALGCGLEVEVFTNLVHVTPTLWKTFTLHGVRVATSWYSDDPGEHTAVTGRRTHSRTLTNIAEAVRRSVPLRVGIIGVGDDQRTTPARRMLEDLGVTDIGFDKLRQVGRGVRDREVSAAELCGHCGDGVIAIGPDSNVWPCVFSRWLSCGNVREKTLSDILSSSTTVAALRDLQAAMPQAPCVPKMCDPQCGPNCSPACVPTCNPKGPCGPRGGCAPNYGSVGARAATADGEVVWLRTVTELATWASGDFWEGNRDAATLTRVRKPTVTRTLDWERGDRWFRAEIMTYVPDEPVSPSPELREAVELPEIWWRDLAASLDALGDHRTERVAISQDAVTRSLREYFADRVDPTVRWWVTSHADLHWNNLTAPACWLLDWESWGAAPLGYDVATLYCHSLLAPDVAARVRSLFAEVLDSPDGVRAQLLAIARMLGRSGSGDYPDIVLPLHRHVPRR